MLPSRPVIRPPRWASLSFLVSRRRALRFPIKNAQLGKARGCIVLHENELVLQRPRGRGGEVRRARSANFPRRLGCDERGGVLVEVTVMIPIIFIFVLGS